MLLQSGRVPWRTFLNSDEGGRLNQGAGVVVFPRAELPPAQNRGNTTTATPPRPREYHNPPPQDRGNTTTPPPPITSKSLPHPEWGGGRGIPVALGNIRPWEYKRPPAPVV